jgi:hypothetical protein
MGRRLVRRTAHIGVLAGVAAGAVKVGKTLHSRRAARHERAAQARRDLWPPVPVKPGTEAHIDADRVDAGRS